MIFPEVTYNLTRLEASLRQYALLSGKTEEETLLFQGRKLAFAVYRGLRALMPVKGSIRAEQLAALKNRSRGVKVRPAVQLDIASKYNAQSEVFGGAETLIGRGKRLGRSVIKNGKRMNLQALMVERELAIRESGRGFSGYSVPKNMGDVESRYGFTLSDFTAALSQPVKEVVLRWLGKRSEFYSDAATALETSKQQKVLAQAIDEVNRDIGVYIQRKLQENASEAGL